MNRRRWLVGAGCLAGALLHEWRVQAQSELQRAGALTLAYWMEVATILGRDELLQSAHTFNQSASERGAWQVRDIERLSREGVDPKLLNFTNKLIQFRSKRLAAAKHEKWYHGVLWRTPAPVVEAQKEAEALREEMEQLRTTLSQRYNCAFPACPFPRW